MLLYGTIWATINYAKRIRFSFILYIHQRETFFLSFFCIIRIDSRELIIRVMRERDDGTLDA